MADSEIISLKDYISDLDQTTLPRILEIHSGVYFQGSVYEISGNECCLSTGDLIKIIHLELQKVTCENASIGLTYDLPPDQQGNFRLAPCRSIGEMMQPKGENGEQGFEILTFQSAKDIHTSSGLISRGDPITVTSVGSSEGKMFARCIVDGVHEQLSVKLPFSLVGEFSENLDGSYSIEEIVRSKALRSRKLIYVETRGRDTEKHLRGELLLSPVYEIQAIMHFRKDFVKIPSDLEVDVKDVSEEQRDVTFIKPLSLLDLMQEPHESFPKMAEILDTADYQSPYKDEWTRGLRKGALLTVHSKQVSTNVVAASMSNKACRHFLISDGYRGTFRRRPREFATAFDLCNAVSPEAPLHVVVTRDCMSNEDDQLSLCVGERLVALAQTTVRVVSGGRPRDIDVLVCNRISDEDEDDDDDDDNDKAGGGTEEVLLPCYLEGRFVEEIRDNRKYTITEICHSFNFPFEVKVTTKDPVFKTDPLKSFPAIRLEESILVPTLLVSLAERPDDFFLIPVEWMSLSLHLLEERPTEDLAPTKVTSVVELTDAMYYNLRKCSNLSSCPPPRPPKRMTASTSTATSLHSPTLQDDKPPLLPKGLSVKGNPNAAADEKPPLLAPRKPIETSSLRATPNEYTKNRKEKKGKTPSNNLKAPECEAINDDDDDSDHDYELIDDQFHLLSLQEIKPRALQ